MPEPTRSFQPGDKVHIRNLTEGDEPVTLRERWVSAGDYWLVEELRGIYHERFMVLVGESE